MKMRSDFGQPLVFSTGAASTAVSRQSTTHVDAEFGFRLAQFEGDDAAGRAVAELGDGEAVIGDIAFIVALAETRKDGVGGGGLGGRSSDACLGLFAVMIDRQHQGARRARKLPQSGHDFLRLGRAVLVGKSGRGRDRVDNDERERQAELFASVFCSLLRMGFEFLERVRIGQQRDASGLAREGLRA